jgi:uncharacterized protein
MTANYFLNLFGHSPIHPLQEHMNIAHHTVETLLLFLDMAFKADWVGAEQYQRQIADLEREADELKKNLRLNLPKSLFMPVSRTDVLELLSAQDSIANKARDIAGLIYGRKMQFPDEIAVLIKKLFERSVAASLQAKNVISELEEVFQAGFKGSELEIIRNMIEELDRIESDTDAIQIEIRGILFNMEKTLPPIDVIFIYKVIEWGGDLADRAHRIGGRLLILLAR